MKLMLRGCYIVNSDCGHYYVPSDLLRFMAQLNNYVRLSQKHYLLCYIFKQIRFVNLLT